MRYMRKGPALAGAAALLLTASLARAAGDAGLRDKDGKQLDLLREKVYSSIAALDKPLTRLDDITASYVSDETPVDEESRDALIVAIGAESSALIQANTTYWALWDESRLAQAVSLIERTASGKAGPDATANFLDTNSIEVLKGDFARTVDRVNAALERENAARGAAEQRKRKQKSRILLSSLGGAAAAALACFLLREKRPPPPPPAEPPAPLPGLRTPPKSEGLH